MSTLSVIARCDQPDEQGILCTEGHRPSSRYVVWSNAYQMFKRIDRMNGTLQSSQYDFLAFAFKIARSAAGYHGWRPTERNSRDIPPSSTTRPAWHLTFESITASHASQGAAIAASAESLLVYSLRGEKETART